MEPDADAQRVIAKGAKRGQSYDVLALMSWAIWNMESSGQDEMHTLNHVIGYIEEYPQFISDEPDRIRRGR